MTKEELIKQAWGKYYKLFYKHINSKGELSELWLTVEQIEKINKDDNFEISSKYRDTLYYRPKLINELRNK